MASLARLGIELVIEYFLGINLFEVELLLIINLHVTCTTILHHIYHVVITISYGSNRCGKEVNETTFLGYCDVFASCYDERISCGYLVRWLRLYKSHIKRRVNKIIM